MTFTVDPKFVDIDLEKEAVKHGFLAGYSPEGNFSSFQSGKFANYEDEFEIQSESERTKAIEILDQKGGVENLVRWVLNQKQEGSCVGNAWTQAVQVVSAKQFGEANIVPMSAISGYKQIGFSPGSGASVDDALRCGTEVGLLPLDTPENRKIFGDKVMPATGFYTPWPNDWKSLAKDFRIVKSLIIRSIPALEQAGINGHPVVVGRAGHSICYLRPSLKQGRGELYVNSWNGWGFGAGGHDSGFGYDTSRMVSASANWAFAIVAVNTPSYLLKKLN